MKTSWEKVSVDSSPIGMYLAQPDGPGPFPAVIVIQNRDGVREFTQEMTRRVAEAGYVAIAPDLYHRESERLIPYSDMKKAIAAMNRLQDPKVMDDVGAAIAHLKAQPNVKSAAIGVTGFCMGGRYTYLAAAHHNKDVKAAVCFYGGGITMGDPSPLSRTGEITFPVYLFFGAKDPLIPMDQVGQINTELTHKKVNFSMKVYPEATHGFFCDERPSYHESAAKDSWEKFKAFFAQHLK